MIYGDFIFKTIKGFIIDANEDKYYKKYTCFTERFRVATEPYYLSTCI